MQLCEKDMAPPYRRASLHSTAKQLASVNSGRQEQKIYRAVKAVTLNGWEEIILASTHIGSPLPSFACTVTGSQVHCLPVLTTKQHGLHCPQTASFRGWIRKNIRNAASSSHRHQTWHSYLPPYLSSSYRYLWWHVLHEEFLQRRAEPAARNRRGGRQARRAWAWTRPPGLVCGFSCACLAHLNAGIINPWQQFICTTCH